MATFRENLSSGMNFLRRRFSSDDIYRDGREADEAPPTATSGTGARLGRKINMSSVQGMTRGILSQAAAAASTAAANVTSAVTPQRVVFNKDHGKVLE